MAFQLHITHPGESGETIIPLPDGDHLIGRSRSAEIQLPQPDVSGKHLILHVDGDSVIAENLSSHGARTAQVTLELPTPIRPGDSIYLGKHTVITLRQTGADDDGDEPEVPTLVEAEGLSEPPPAPPKPEPQPVPAPEPKPQPKPEPQPVPATEPKPQPKSEPQPVPAPEPKPEPKPEIPEEDVGATVVDAAPAPAPAPEVPADIEATIVGGAPAPAIPDDPDVTIVGGAPAPAVPDDMAATVLDDTPAADMAATVADSTPAAAPDAPAKNDDDVFKTNVMQTRIASTEELEFLRRQDRNTKRSKRLKYIVPLIAAAVALGAVFFFKGQAPEEKLSWPLNDAGQYSEAPYDLGDGGHAKGRFSLIAPVTKSTKALTANGTLEVFTQIGRDRDVVMRLTLSSKRSPAYLHESRETTFRNWIREVSASGGHWNFDQISDLFFLGKNNGLPCMSAAYTREIENQSWYGEVIFFRNGDERIVRMAEIPGSERLRGAGFLANNAFLFTSPQFVENHWEGAPELISGDPAELLQEAKSLLVKMSPSTWEKITMLLRSVLVQATEKKMTELRDDALNQLRKLRNAQKVWYNAQMITYLKEKAAGNTRAADLIRDSCLAVFSSKDDLRHRNIQRNIWE